MEEETDGDSDKDEERPEGECCNGHHMDPGTYIAFEELELQTRMIGNIVETLSKGFMAMSSEMDMLAQIISAKEVIAEAGEEDEMSLNSDEGHEANDQNEVNTDEGSDTEDDDDE
jgi:hypothetical protein